MLQMQIALLQRQPMILATSTTAAIVETVATTTPNCWTKQDRQSPHTMIKTCFSNGSTTIERLPYAN